MKIVKFKDHNTVYAKDQSQYRQLPTLKLNTKNGEVISCWKMSLRERLKVLFTGKIWLCLLSFNKPLTPSIVSVNRKELYSRPDDSIGLLKKVSLLLKSEIKNIKAGLSNMQQTIRLEKHNRSKIN